MVANSVEAVLLVLELVLVELVLVELVVLEAARRAVSRGELKTYGSRKPAVEKGRSANPVV